MQVIWCLKFCNMTKSGGGDNPAAPNSGGGLVPPFFPVIYAHVLSLRASQLSRTIACACHRVKMSCDFYKGSVRAFCKVV